MPAPKNNEYWKIAKENGKIGRNKVYTPEELTDKINEWIEITQNSVWEKEDFIKSGPAAGEKVYLKTATPFLIQDLCLFLGVNRNYFTQLSESIKDKKDNDSKDFSCIISHVEQLITNQKLQGATIGAYNPMIIARIEGLKEKQDITSNDDSISLSVNVLNKDISKDLEKE